MNRLSCRFVVTVAGLCFAALLGAQGGPPPGFGGGFNPGAFGLGARGWENFGGGRGLLRDLAGAPFSAQAVTTDQRTLSNGNQINRTVTVSVARDSQGRTWEQTTAPAGRGTPGGANPTQTVIFINDPVAHMSYEVWPARQAAIAHPLPSNPGRGGRGGGATPPVAPRPNPNRPAGPTVASLGTNTVNGVLATGSSFTTTIPAGQIGNTQAITVVRQEWYSDQLHLVVSATDNDPRTGVTTFNLQNLIVGEPDSSLFIVPSNYTVTNAGRGGRRGPGGTR